jgi:hypothetical protein
MCLIGAGHELVCHAAVVLLVAAGGVAGQKACQSPATDRPFALEQHWSV